MATLPYVKVIRSHIADVQTGIVFSFRAAPQLQALGLEVARRVFVGPNFKSAYESAMEVWVDYDGVDLDSHMVDDLIGQMAREVGFTITEPVPLHLVSDFAVEAMRPHSS